LPLLYEFTVFQFAPSKNSSVPKSWLNLVVPGSGALSLLFVSPRGTANRSVAVRLSNLPPVILVPDSTVTSPSILISPDREFKLPLVVSAMDTVFTTF